VRKFIAVAVAAAALGATAPARADVVPVQSLTGNFAATNTSVTKTPDGVHFGVYADASRTGGSLFYSGANGLTLGQLTALGYTYNYSTSDDNRLGAPYLRVFLDADGDGAEDSDVVFDPTVCGTATPPENTDITVDVAASTVRFNDDSCSTAANQRPYADIQAENADALVTGIFITQGFSGGQDASAFVRDLTVNADTFAFDVPPGTDTGPQGTPDTGGQGPAGPQGAPGTTTVVQVPAPAVPNARAVNPPASCRGATVRGLRAPLRSRERFLRVNAALQTPNGFRPLPVRGRTVTLNLTGRGEGNYNVRLISRYRTRSGKVRRVVTRRNLSVACS
jgi:hypothetical protein